jgi:hypothetical protein
VEARIADAPNEWLYVYAPDGRFEGTPDNIDLSPELKGFTVDVPPRPVLRDHLIVHNHPPTAGPDAVVTYPPSDDDLALIIDREAQEYVVVSGRYRYVVRRPGPHWIGDGQRYRGVIDVLRDALANELGPAVRTAADAAARQQLVLARLCEGGWIDYERSTRNRKR